MSCTMLVGRPASGPSFKDLKCSAFEFGIVAAPLVPRLMLVKRSSPPIPGRAMMVDDDKIDEGVENNDPPFSFLFYCAPYAFPPSALRGPGRNMFVKLRIRIVAPTPHRCSTMDAQYLKKTVGTPLQRALTSMVTAQPKDEVEVSVSVVLILSSLAHISTASPPHVNHSTWDSSCCVT